jgi:hypothetical protein
MANIPLFKGGQNENFKTFLKDFLKSCIFGVSNAHTQEQWLNFFGKESFDMV